MDPTLRGVDLKLRRADEHLRALDAMRERFLDHDRRVVGKFDSQAGDYIFRLEGFAIPDDVSVLVGEYAYALRSALDNLVWQLVVLRQGSVSADLERKLQFPVYDDVAQLRKKSDPWRCIEGVASEDRAFIQRAQPYQDGGDGDRVFPERWHPLTMLDFLCNTDKHRYIHVAAGAPAGNRFEEVERKSGLTLRLIVPVFWDGRAMATPGGMYFPFEPFLHAVPGADVPNLSFVAGGDDTTEVARLVGIGDGQPDVDVKPVPDVDITFSGREKPMSMHDLILIHTHVENIVEHFRHLFAAPAV